MGNTNYCTIRREILVRRLRRKRLGFTEWKFGGRGGSGPANTRRVFFFHFDAGIIRYTRRVTKEIFIFFPTNSIGEKKKKKVLLYRVVVIDYGTQDRNIFTFLSTKTRKYQHREIYLIYQTSGIYLRRLFFTNFFRFL